MELRYVSASFWLGSFDNSIALSRFVLALSFFLARGIRTDPVQLNLFDCVFDPGKYARDPLAEKAGKRKGDPSGMQLAFPFFSFINNLETTGSPVSNHVDHRTVAGILLI